MFRIALIGAGSRGCGHCTRALTLPGTSVAAIVDPDSKRLEMAAAQFSVPDSACFSSVDALLASGIEFDGAFNTTMDAQHVETTLPLVRAGKPVMLEKPICLNKDELLMLYGEVKRAGVPVLICHGLRYTPFYSEIKKRVLSGEIGTIKHVYASESVGQSHMAAAFIRGKWGSSVECGSKILMAKCCHDMDLLTWFKSGVRPVKVASFGSLFEYRPEKAREVAGKRCLVDCAIENNCPYSAKLCYLDRPHDWGVYAWRDILDKGTDLHGETIPEEEKIHYLKTAGRFGRCVYNLDNDQNDTQTVSVQYADGTCATFGLNCGSPYANRYIRLEGTHGMIEGKFMEQEFTVRRETHDPAHEFTEETVRLTGSMEGHGGGDIRLVEDFIARCQGREPSISCTSFEDSMYGHLLGFDALLAQEDERVVRIEELPL